MARITNRSTQGLQNGADFKEYKSGQVQSLQNGQKDYKSGQGLQNGTKRLQVGAGIKIRAGITNRCGTVLVGIVKFKAR